MKMLPANLINVTSKVDAQMVRWILVLVSLGLMILGVGAPLGGGAAGTGS